jgi:hypothetical protein
MYLNGSLIDTEPTGDYDSRTNTNSTYYLTKNGSLEMAHGTFWDLRVYGRQLSATEIQAIYNNGLGIKGNNLPTNYSKIKLDVNYTDGTSADTLDYTNAVMRYKLNSIASDMTVEDSAGTYTGSLKANAYSYWPWHNGTGSDYGRVGSHAALYNTNADIVENADRTGSYTAIVTGSQTTHHSLRVDNSAKDYEHDQFTVNVWGKLDEINGTYQSLLSHFNWEIRANPTGSFTAFMTRDNGTNTSSVTVNDTSPPIVGSWVMHTLVVDTDSDVYWDNLVAWYKFRNIATDETYNANDATNYNVSYGSGDAPTTILGYYGEFNGSDARCEVPYDSSLDLGSDFSISAWIKWEGENLSSDDNYIVSKRKSGNQMNYDLYISTGSKLIIHVEDAADDSDHSVTSGSSLSLNTWYHVVGTYDSNDGKLRLYLDGELNKEGSDISANAPWYTGSGDDPCMTIGMAAFATVGNYMFIGSIDDVRIYNVPLSSTQVKHIYDVGTGNPTGSGTVKYYINGELHGSSNAASYSIWKSYGNDGNYLEWGESAHGIGDPWIGSIGDTLYFDRALEEDEIGSIYNTWVTKPMYNPVTTVDGKTGVKFDGHVNYIDVGTGSSTGSWADFAYSAWFYLDNFDFKNYSRASIFGGSYSAQELLYLTTDGRIGFGLDDTHITTDTGTATTGKWFNLIGNYKYDSEHPFSTKYEMWLNGEYIGSNSYWYSWPIQSWLSGNRYIGYEPRFNQNFTGVISDVTVFNRSLTEYEIKKLYNNTGEALTAQALIGSDTINLNIGASTSFTATDTDGLRIKLINNAKQITINNYKVKYTE